MDSYETTTSATALATTSAAAVPLRALALELTKGCNLRCGYCFYADRTDAYDAANRMSEETAFRAVDRLVEDAPAGEAAHLHFFGGEPLLDFPLVKATTEYALRRAAEKQRKITFEVTTNGTRFDDAVIDHLNRHAFQVGVSFDGPPEIQDSARPWKGGSSHALALPGIRKLVESRRGTPLEAKTHCSVVVTRRDLDLVKITRYLEELGFRKILLTSATDNQSQPIFAFRESDLPALREAYDRLAAEYERRVRAGEPVAENWFPDLMERLLSGERRTQFCGGGMDYLGVAADGKLHLCYRFFENDEFAMGDVKSGVDRTVTQRLLDESIEKRPTCSTCWARHFCGGGCHHDNLMASGSTSEPNYVTCEIFRHSMSRTLEAWGRLSKDGKIGGRRMSTLPTSNAQPTASPAAFGAGDRPKRTPGCHVRDLGNEHIVYEPHHHEVAVLNPTAWFIFECCDGSRTVAQIAEEMSKRFDAPVDVLRLDLQRTLTEIRGRNLIAT